MMLGQLIEELEARDPNARVKRGFGHGFSDRGNYSDACFAPIDETTFGEMLSHAKALLGSKQDGYKGGEFEMHEYVDTNIGVWGECGEPITSYHFLFWDICANESLAVEVEREVGGAVMESERISLKWGTLKEWHLTQDVTKDIVRRYFDLGAPWGAMQQCDTQEQKDLICELIDKSTAETIYLDWDGVHVSKEQAKEYVQKYGKKSEVQR